MIFAVKADLCRKARLVIGGHIIDASMYDFYASTVKTENIRLLMHQLVMSRCNLLAGDIGNAYNNAYTKEKIYSRAGIEFGDKAGVKVIVRKALYGLKGSANAWWIQLSDDLCSVRFTRSRINLSVWYKKRDDGTRYDYIATHVDDFIVIADEPQKYPDELFGKGICHL